MTRKKPNNDRDDPMDSRQKISLPHRRPRSAGINTKGLVFCTLIIAMPYHAHAIGNFNPDPKELRLLPHYCGPRAQSWGNDGNRPEVRRWLNVFGSDYVHMHHYCQALLSLRKAPLARDQKSRNFMYKTALQNLEYTEQRVSPGFRLRPELYVLMAQAHEGLGNTGKALDYARRAVRAKQDYTRGIALFADLSIKLGQTDTARKALRKGLSLKPKSRLLRRRMACLNDDKLKGRHCPPGYHQGKQENHK